LPAQHGVSSKLKKRFLPGAARRQLEAEEALFVVGEPGDGCYRLEKGLLKIVITSLLGKDRILAILGPGAIVGELAMIDKGPRSASVFALKRCELSSRGIQGQDDSTSRNLRAPHECAGRTVATDRREHGRLQFPHC